MKYRLRCPRCSKEIEVSKHLHASYTCPHCNIGLVITHDMLLNPQHLHAKYRRFRKSRP